MKKINTKHLILWMLTFAFICIGQPALAQTGFSQEKPAEQRIATDSVAIDTLRTVEAKLMPIPSTTEDTTNDSITQENARHLRAISAPADTAKLNAINDSISQKKQDVRLPKKQFSPDPQRALWLSLVFPGAGQIYNRKYWKLPIIYGGFLGCTYALLWNQQMYMDYSQAYLDIMDDDPNTDSYKDMLPPRYDITGQEERFKKIFKNKKDHFRRYRDLSAFCFVGVYLLSVVDAYVDAQLSEFDITPDLSLRVEPAVISQKGISTDKNAYGIGCSFNF